MMPGARLIVQPRGCDHFVWIGTIMSGNTFDSVWWSDGKFNAPMLPVPPWLRRSPSEGLFWTDDCVLIAKHRYFDPAEKEKWKHVLPAEEPSGEDYSVALTTGMADTPARLRYVRQRLWWEVNDTQRASYRTADNGMLRMLAERGRSEAERENLEALALLLSEDDPATRFLKAEVARELGDFTESLRLLGGEYPPHLKPHVATLQALCTAGNIKVVKLYEDALERRRQ